MQHRKSLSQVIQSKGGTLQPRQAADMDLVVFYRDVIREGELMKLPPVNNKIQAWRRRWFRLVVSLDRALSGGPVILEYYSNHKKKTPKVHTFLSDLVSALCLRSTTVSTLGCP